MSDEQLPWAMAAGISTAMIIGLLVLFPRIKSHSQSWQIMSFVLAAMLGAVSIVTAAQTLRLNQDEELPAGSPPETAALKFTKPRPGDQVGQKPSVLLHGDVPAGERLWIFVRSEQKLYVQGLAQEATNGWSFRGVTLGGNDPADVRASYTILAVLANTQADAKLEDLESRTHGDEPVELPKGARRGPEVTVVRSK